MRNQLIASKRILSIEDEAAIQELIAIYLELNEGWQVLPASNGQDGLALAKTEQPDAILLDVMMPDFNGIETFRQLKADPATRDIPVLFVTAKTQVKDPKNQLDLSKVKTLVKPFDFDYLANQITEEIEKNNLNRLVKSPA